MLGSLDDAELLGSLDDAGITHRSWDAGIFFTLLERVYGEDIPPLGKPTPFQTK